MKYLIVNGDDFGASRGINRGFVEAHRHGVLTSASMMIEGAAVDEAAGLSRSIPQLGVGLHTVLTTEDCTPLINFNDPAACETEIERQIERFVELMGCRPMHLDSHHNIVRHRSLTPVFRAIARKHSLPLREHSAAKYVSSFYGQWDDGETHLEQVSPRMLLQILDNEASCEFTELGCHPGYCDDEFASTYLREREAELRTLKNPEVRRQIIARGFQLIHFGTLSTLVAAKAGVP